MIRTNIPSYVLEIYWMHYCISVIIHISNSYNSYSNSNSNSNRNNQKKNTIGQPIDGNCMSCSLRTDRRYLITTSTIPPAPHGQDGEVFADQHDANELENCLSLDSRPCPAESIKVSVEATKTQTIGRHHACMPHVDLTEVSITFVCK